MKTFGFTRTRALMLASYEWSSSSIRTSMITEKEGLISGLAKGCRRNKNMFAASLEPFSFSEVVVYRRRPTEPAILIEGVLLDDFPGLRTSLTKIDHAYICNRLVLTLSSFAEQEMNAFELLKHTYKAIEEKPSRMAPLILAGFAVKLSVILGYGLNLKGSCPHTSKLPNMRCILLSEGRLACNACLAGKKADELALLSAAEISYLKKLDELPLGRISSLHPKWIELKNILIALERYFSYHYQRPVKLLVYHDKTESIARSSHRSYNDYYKPKAKS